MESRLAADIRYLASDELGGRGPFTEGLERAADHIAEQFRAAGLSTARFGNPPFQIFRSTQRVALGAGNSLSLHPDSAPPRRLEPFVEFTPLSLSAAGRFDLPLVFAGYGLHCPDDGLDDYSGRDVTGCLAVVLRHAPPSAREFLGPVSRVRQQNPRRLEQTFLARKAAVAAGRGAAGLLLVTDSLHLPAAAVPVGQSFKGTASNGTASNEKELRREPPLRTADSSPAAEPLLAFQVDGKLDKPDFFVLHCRRAAIDSLLQARGQPTLAELEASLDARYRRWQIEHRPAQDEPHDKAARDKEPRDDGPRDDAPRDDGPRDDAPRGMNVDGKEAFESLLAGCRASGEVSLARRTFALKNVLGELPGAGALAEETVLIGAHYDHLGQGGAASLAPWTKATHNGADDNASGTAALLELARQLAARRDPARCRRFLFVAFSAEEMGLVGSERFVNAPPVPLDRIVAMLNLDMVGRLRSDRLTISGVGTAREFESLARRLAKQHSFAPRLDPSGYGPSDHATFAARGIPVLHFFTGLHEDYHRPSDDFERIELAGLRRIVALVAELAVELGHAERRPTATGESLADLIEGPKSAPTAKSTSRPQDSAPARNPSPSPNAPSTAPRRGLGIVIAEHVDSGVVIQRVQAGSRAEQAGLRAGDRILGVANVNVATGAELLGALKNHRSPSTETFRIQRGKTVLEVRVGW